MKWQSQNNSFSGTEKKGECEDAAGKEGHVQVRSSASSYTVYFEKCKRWILIALFVSH